MPSMRLSAIVAVFLTAALALPATAHAGGVGFYNGTGVHVGDALEREGTGVWLDEGGGIELFLGRRDSRVHGRLRIAYNAIVDLSPEPITRVRHSGFLSLGVKVEFLDDVEQPFGFYLATDVGVSPLTTHLRSYFTYSIGPGVRVRPAGPLELFAELHGFVRYEKVIAGGPMLFLGARLHID